jgi:NADP-dependent 3-hydroxy acid dehydrogenase YdfG
MTEPATRPLAGRTAWVTGAASGIGEATALALAKAGATVAITSRRADTLEALADRIRADGGEAIAAAGDVTDLARMEAIASELSQHGGLDILVNNAGNNIPERSWGELTAEAIDLLLDANLRGTLQISRLVLPMMQAGGGGVFIHIGSWAAHFISTGPGPIYTAAKSGVVAMSHTINLEHGVHGIRSCVLSPGDVHTPLMDKRPMKISDEAKRKMLQPEDIAGLVLHVATLPAHVCVNEIIVGPTFR